MKILKYLITFITLLVFACSTSNDEGEQQEAECIKTCDAGFALNQDTCECEKAPCTTICNAGFTLTMILANVSVPRLVTLDLL